MTLDESNLKKLAVESQSGDSGAYRELLVTLNSFLKQHLRKRVFAKDEIEEVIQETLLAIHKSLHTYDEAKSFMGWFMGIVEYKVVDYIRSRKKSAQSNSLEAIPDLTAYMHSDPGLKLGIEKAFEKLNQKEKSVLTLLKLEGHSISIVAEKLQLSESNVKVIAHRAYNNLKRFLEEEI